MNRPLTKDQKVQLVKISNGGNKSLQATADEFNAMFPNRHPISKQTVYYNLQKFEDTGNVNRCKHVHQPKDDRTIQILAEFAVNPNDNIRNVAARLETSYGTVQKSLKKYKGKFT